MAKIRKRTTTSQRKSNCRLTYRAAYQKVNAPSVEEGHELKTGNVVWVLSILLVTGVAAGGTPGETQSFDFCEVDPGSVEHASLLDSGRCVVREIVVAECRSSKSLVRNCDESFFWWCNELGGDVEACADDEPVDSAIVCGANSYLTPECDEDFIAACDRDDNEFLCGGPSCSSGRCEPAPFIACCRDCSDVSCSGCSEVGPGTTKCDSMLFSSPATCTVKLDVLTCEPGFPPPMP